MALTRLAFLLTAVAVATLKTEPNRFRAVYGAARSAALSGDRTTARAYYTQMLKITERADSPGRKELEEAKRF